MRILLIPAAILAVFSYYPFLYVLFYMLYYDQYAMDVWDGNI